MASNAGIGVFAIRQAKRLGPLTAVHSISLQVFGGQFFGPLGPNSDGKFTETKKLYGLLRLTAGEIKVAGFGFAK